MKIFNCFKSKIHFIILFSIIFFYIVNNYIWLKLSAPFPTFFYYAFDFERVIDFYKALNKFRLDLVINQLINNDLAYIHSLTAALIALVFGKSNIVINIFNNIPYFVIAVFSIYMIAKRVSDKATALLAVAIFSLYPAVYGTSRLYVLEFAVMGMLSLCILCLLNSENFTNRRYSLLFGLALGWAMLIKYSPIAFIIGPLIYVVIRALTSYRRNETVSFSSTIFNIGLSALVAVAVMGIKYFNFDNVTRYLARPFRLARPSEPWYRLDNLRIYTLGIFEHQLSLFFFLVLIIAFFGFLFKAKRKIIIILLSWIMIPWLIFLIMPCSYRSTHFIIPYLPAMALISAIGLMHILKRNQKLKVIIIGLILTIGIIQYYDFSFGFGFDFSKYNIMIKNDKSNNMPVYYYILSEDICSRPQYDGIYNEVIFSISKKSNRYGSKVVMLPRTIFSSSCVSPSVWNCIQWFKNLPFEISALDINIQFIDKVLADLKEADFILYAGNKNVKDSSYLDYILKKIIEQHTLQFDNESLAKINQFLEQDYGIFRGNFNKLINEFELVETIHCKNAYFHIYKKS